MDKTKKLNEGRTYPEDVRQQDSACLLMFGMTQGLNADIKADDVRRGLVDINAQEVG